MKTQKEILLLNFFKEGSVVSESVDFGDSVYRITEHKIGWDFTAGSALIKKYDGKVDGFALGGIQKRIQLGRANFIHPGFQKLMRSASTSPIYVSDRLRHFFSDWTMQRILRENEQFFKGRKTLFHCASISPIYCQILRTGGVASAADALTLAGIPRLINQASELETWIKLIHASLQLGKTIGRREPLSISVQKTEPKLHQWIKNCDIFFTFGNLIDLMSDLSSFEGKTIFVDYLSKEAQNRIQLLKDVNVIEYVPQKLRQDFLNSQPLSALAAMLDLERKKISESMTSDEFLLKWVQDQKVEPTRVDRVSGRKRKCAFIVHPLHQNDLWRVPALRSIQKAPGFVREGLELLGTKLPIFKLGTIDGIKSKTTGQEVECDIYVMAATPKKMLAMDEQDVYNRLIQGADLAAKNGAAMIGLGAYTKVVGDAGVTVSRGAPIPVTNGNSYSAATSIWAAEIMLEKVALPRTRKAMVIGATGSIGRVSALVLSEKYKELVLVATSLDKLLEMKREVLAHSPNVKVTVTTCANKELAGVEMILTATSNQGGKLFDINQVMSGTVICDCSRPFDVTQEDAEQRPDVIVIQSGEVLLPGNLKMNCDIGLPKPSVYACLAETVLLTLEGRIESYSLSKRLSQPKVKEILELGHKHGATLSVITGPLGIITDEQIKRCRDLALQSRVNVVTGLKLKLDKAAIEAEQVLQTQSTLLKTVS